MPLSRAPTPPTLLGRLPLSDASANETSPSSLFFSFFAPVRIHRSLSKFFSWLSFLFSPALPPPEQRGKYSPLSSTCGGGVPISSLPYRFPPSCSLFGSIFGCIVCNSLFFSVFSLSFPSACPAGSFEKQPPVFNYTRVCLPPPLFSPSLFAIF